MTGIPEEVVRMVLANDQRRAERAKTAWNTLRNFERRVLREGAVMAYVIGRQDGFIKGRAAGRLGVEEGGDYPPDLHIVREVLEYCDSNDDLYPFLADACAGRRRRITRKRLLPGEEVAR